MHEVRVIHFSIASCVKLCFTAVFIIHTNCGVQFCFKPVWLKCGITLQSFQPYKKRILKNRAFFRVDERSSDSDKGRDDFFLIFRFFAVWFLTSSEIQFNSFVEKKKTSLSNSKNEKVTKKVMDL